MSASLAVNALPLLALAAGCSPERGGAMPPMAELSFFTDDAFGASLQTAFGPETVWPVASHTVAVGELAGSDDLRLFDFPPGEQLLRVGRFGPGASAEPESVVALDTEALCAPLSCVEEGPAIDADIQTALATDDGDVVAVISMSQRDRWAAVFVAKLGPDGAIRWTQELPSAGAGTPFALAQRGDGGVIAAWQHAPEPDTRAAADSGAAVLFVGADGEVERTAYLRASAVDDAGHGLPADVRPYIAALLPLSDGGLAVAGALAYSRSIECGSYDAPQAPTSLRCSDYTSEAFVARLDAEGELSWQRALGDGFEGERSGLGSLVALDDDHIGAVGSIAVEPGHSPDPYTAGFAVWLSADGRVSRRVRVQPGQLSTEGGAQFAHPIAGPDGALDLLYLRGYRDAWAVRLTATGDLSTVRPLPSGNAEQPYFTDVAVVAGGWAMIETWTQDARQGWLHHLGR